MKGQSEICTELLYNFVRYSVLPSNDSISQFIYYFQSDSEEFHQIFNISVCKAVSIQRATLLGLMLYAFRCQFQMDLHFSCERFFALPRFSFSFFIGLKTTGVYAFLSLSFFRSLPHISHLVYIFIVLWFKTFPFFTGKMERKTVFGHIFRKANASNWIQLVTWNMIFIKLYPNVTAMFNVQHIHHAHQSNILCVFCSEFWM